MSNLPIFSIIFTVFSAYKLADGVVCYQCAEFVNGTFNGGPCVNPDSEKTKKEEGCAVCISVNLFDTDAVMVRDCLRNIKLKKDMSCCVNDKENLNSLYCACNDDLCTGNVNVQCEKNEIDHFHNHVNKRSVMIKNSEFYDKFNNPDCSTKSTSKTSTPSISTTKKSSGSAARISLVGLLIALFILFAKFN